MNGKSIPSSKQNCLFWISQLVFKWLKWMNCSRWNSNLQMAQVCTSEWLELRVATHEWTLLPSFCTSNLEHSPSTWLQHSYRVWECQIYKCGLVQSATEQEIMYNKMAMHLWMHSSKSHSLCERIHGNLQPTQLLHTYHILIAQVHIFSSIIFLNLDTHITLGSWFINSYRKYRSEEKMKIL